MSAVDGRRSLLNPLWPAGCNRMAGAVVTFS